MPREPRTPEAIARQRVLDKIIGQNIINQRSREKISRVQLGKMIGLDATAMGRTAFLQMKKIRRHKRRIRL